VHQERGALAPRGVQAACKRETRKVVAWQSQTRFGKPRRADARRSCEHAFVHRKRRYFAGDRTPCMAPRAGVSAPVGNIRRYESEMHTAGDMSRMQPGAGGRQPPVGYIRRCESERHTAGDMSHMQPGAAGVSQPWYADPVANALHRHGGLTPAALDCAFD
jgi:hypothetical protein